MNIEKKNIKKSEKVLEALEALDDNMISISNLSSSINKNKSSIYIDGPITKNQYTLKNRLKLYYKTKFYLNKIDKNECLKNIKVNNIKLMTLANKLFLDKRIGTKSENGSIYLSTIKKISDLLVVSKVNNRNNANLKEINIMNDLTENLVILEKTKHFPLIYSNHSCIKKNINNMESLLSVNELCNGDLKMLLDDNKIYKENKNILLNILFQVFISIATYQEYSKHIHDDCHYGNFLYQINTEKGYYKYIYDNNIFYLKTCPYNFMLYDFGLTRKPKKKSSYVYFMDFWRIIHAFIPENEGGWNIHLKNSKFINIIIDIKNNIQIMIKNKKKYNFNILLKLMMPIIKNICKKKLNKNDILINNKPYIIK
jgi:hypothetical protein